MTLDYEAAQQEAKEQARRYKQKQEQPQPNGHDATAQTDNWPVIEETAFGGLLGEISRLIAPQTEADPVAILAHQLVFFGNAAGRNAYYLVEDTMHTTNLFTALIGRTSFSRKGTAEKRTRRVFREVDPEWERARVASGLSSGEGLIWHVRDPIESEVLDKKSKKTERMVTDHGVADKRLCVFEPEFGRVLAVFHRQGNSLSHTLREAWESGRLGTLTKNSPAQATDAMISVIAHITADELLRNLDKTEIANGLVNRFILLLVRRSQILPFGGDQIEFGNAIERLQEALNAATTPRQLMMDTAAKNLWRELYEVLASDNTPGLLGALTARAAPQVIRMSLIHALADQASVIGEPHLKAALALWRYSEASARAVFGDSLGDPIADMILAALRERKPNGMSRSDISNLFGRNTEAAKLAAALDRLKTAGKATSQIVPAAGRGRPTEMWFAK